MEPKPWYQSKTFWAGVGAIFVGIGIWLETGDIVALGTSVTGMVMIVFRIVTKQPLG